MIGTIGTLNMDICDMAQTELAREMRNLRRSRGKLIADQARELGVSPSQISEIEIGELAPPEEYEECVIRWLVLSEAEARRLHVCLKRISEPQDHVQYDQIKKVVRQHIPQKPSEIRALKLNHRESG